MAIEPTAGTRTARLRIEGRVQGVGYRAWVEETARGLGLGGWVRNRLDGTVEALLSGDPASVDAMISRCNMGRPAARVSKVTAVDVSTPPPQGFVVLATI